jgi:protein phosphatase
LERPAAIAWRIDVRKKENQHLKDESEVTLVPLAPFDWHAISDKGKVREENQDSFSADPDMALFLVSDGIGGQQAGTLASRIVTEVLPAMLKQGLRERKRYSPKAIMSMLKQSIVELSRHMRIESANQTGFRGMGATLVMALIIENRVFIANMGDSRAYLFRKRKLTQLSEDHSVVATLLRTGEIKSEEVKHHPARGQLTRSMGMEADVYPYVQSKCLKEKDRLLLCSDGLTGQLDDKEISTLLRKHKDPQAACQVLIDAANVAGGHDNITVLIVDWIGQCNSCA